MSSDGLGLPLAGGYLQRLPDTSSVTQVIGVMNDIIDRLNDQLKTQIFSDGTTKRMLIGYQKDGWGVGQDFGIKVSLPGVDVTTAVDAKLLFKMATDKWSWRDSTGALIREFDIANGVETYRNADGNVVKKFDMHQGTSFDYDPSTGINFLQEGKLPDNSFGWVVASSGNNVADIYS